MAAKTRKTDPLSRYFKDLDEDQLSDSEEDDAKDANHEDSFSNLKNNSISIEQVQSNSNNRSTLYQKSPFSNTSRSTAGTNTTTSSSSSVTAVDKLSKLPSANDCLNSQNKPAFLQVLEKKELNWDKLEKRLAEENASSEPIDYKTNAVPPPASYEPMTDPDVKVEKEGRKRKKSEEDISTKAYKVHKEDDDDDDKL
ncbi:UPF0690 protein A [Biomphalaria pfeifferi]|uniref:UPF0690 protein A n=1 Tax=Biomphalaria pfeifferi TaxID=112525 RepID=A0AAD8BA46_BIOPF|nr:UPF0690 protein A [Biomphalaria pfeifferi]